MKTSVLHENERRLLLQTAPGSVPNHLIRKLAESDFTIAANYLRGY